MFTTKTFCILLMKCQIPPSIVAVASLPNYESYNSYKNDYLRLGDLYMM